VVLWWGLLVPSHNDLTLLIAIADNTLIKFLSEIYMPEIKILVIDQLAQMQSGDQFALPASYIQCNLCKQIAHDILRLMFNHMVKKWEEMGIITDEVSDSAVGDGAAQAGGNVSCGDAEATKQILIPPGKSLPISTRQSSEDPPDERGSSGSPVCEQVPRLQHPSLEVKTVVLLMWSLPP
jgi:hypothetical protein